MRNIILILGTVFFLFLSESCRKRDPKTYPLLQTTKDWMFFDVGTWWVYENINNGDIDSHSVIESKVVTLVLNDPSKPQRTDEAAIVKLSNNYKITLDGTGGGNGIFRSETLTSEGGHTYLYDPPNALGSSTVTSKVINFMPSNTFGGKTDTLVIRKDNQDRSEGGDTMEYHVFKGVGIIRKINHSKNEDWQLQRFNIKMNPN